MSNYKQDQAVGWQRSKGVAIKNGYKEIPSIEFLEEFVVEVSGEVIQKKDVGSVTSTLKNPTTAIDLLNPETDAVVGSISYGDVYAALYSMYRYLANKRDVRDALKKQLEQAKADLAAFKVTATSANQTLLDAQITEQNTLKEGLNRAQQRFDEASDYL